MATKAFLRELRRKNHLGEFKHSRSTPYRAENTHMARRRSSTRRSGFRRLGRRSSRSRGFGGGGEMGALMNGAIYGVARLPAANLVGGFTQNLPFGNLNSSVALAGLSWLATKIPMLRNIGIAGLSVEAAHVTMQVTAPMTGSMGSGSSATIYN
jgi:hypothetical protein